MYNHKCNQCGAEDIELDPTGPEQVDNPKYIPGCDCAEHSKDESDDLDLSPALHRRIGEHEDAQNQAKYMKDHKSEY